MAAPQITHSGLDTLLTPEESVVVLVDHQAFQFANMHSHEPQVVVGNTIALAKTAKVFGVPTILTTVNEEAGGYILSGIQEVFPDQKPINRSSINAWQDPKLVEAVAKTGRRKLVIAGLWTEVCVAMPAMQAGIKPITWLAVLCEWQRDWARQDTVPPLAKILSDHGGGSGVAIGWEWQLLAAGQKKG